MDHRFHGQALLRDLAIINARTAREHGPLPAGGLPVEAKRKPVLPKPAPPTMATDEPTLNEEPDMDWTRIAAAATLTAAASLSACAADQGAHTAATPPPQTQSEPVTAAVEALPAKTQVEESQAVQAEDGPTIPASELGNRILALIGSFQSLKDLERPHVEQVVQMTLTKRPTMDDGYQVFGKTTEGWVYRIGVSRLSKMEDSPTILIDLDDGVEPWTDQQPTYCTLAFEPLANEMVSMGYERSEKMFRLKGEQWWGFRRENTDSHVVIGAMVYVYKITIDGHERYCISNLSFGGDPINE